MIIKRRDFIKYSALSGLSLSFGFCHSKGNIKSHSKRLGVALVGLGGYSAGQLAPALQLTKNCYLAGIVTGSPHKIPEWQKKYNIKDKNVYNYDNMHTIANNEEIDVVYVVVPTALHAKYSLIAANAGKHVWCEKPMAMTVEECQSIIDICNKNKVKLSVGYRMQHEPNTRTVIEYASSLPYGKIKSVKALAGYGGGGGKGWRFERAMGGGALYDMGVYTINGIRYASAQEPIGVLNAKQYRNRPELFNDVDETTEYELEFASGIQTIGKTSVSENMGILEVICEKGDYHLSPMQSYNGVQGRTSNGILLNKPIANQQAQQMDDDALAILNNKAVMVPGEEGMRDIRIVQAIIQAAETGKGVKL
ncbi:MAG: Gfo/Idh/MocA family oxidoreductase [Microscillaceae bacterium]|nr:Gfo/Idh/MocA family oxidoreductase [Microscillaceae bacterium]